MLRSIKALEGYRLKAVDGELGKVRDFYFDKTTWHIRYIVVDTGPWLVERDVLIAPAAVQNPDWEDAVLPVELTKAEVENSPRVSPAERVSRGKQQALSLHFGWPIYPNSVVAGGAGPTVGGFLPVLPVETIEEPAEEATGVADKKTNLESEREMRRFHIASQDGEEVGHVDDTIVDDEHWVIRYVVVDTGHWLPGRKVLVAPSWIKQISHADQKVFVDMTRDLIEHSPLYDPTIPVNRDYEGRMCDYYGRPKYWEGGPHRLEAHYKCGACGRTFLSMVELRGHRAEHRPGYKPPPARAKPKEEDLVHKIESQRPEEHSGYQHPTRSI